MYSLLCILEESRNVAQHCRTLLSLALIHWQVMGSDGGGGALWLTSQRASSSPMRACSTAGELDKVALCGGLPSTLLMTIKWLPSALHFSVMQCWGAALLPRSGKAYARLHDVRVLCCTMGNPYIPHCKRPTHIPA